MQGLGDLRADAGHARVEWAQALRIYEGLDAPQAAELRHRLSASGAGSRG